MKHQSVLLNEVLGAFESMENAVIVDGTLGAGGHAKAILEKLGESAKLIGFDKDPLALEEARMNLMQFGGRVTMINDDFKNIAQRLEELKVGPVSGALVDLGVSSMQLDEPGRGFSFMNDGPLDMRMNPNSPLSAESIVNDYSKADLLQILWRLGEERFARKIVDAILVERKKKRIQTTLELAELIKRSVPGFYRHGRIHPATKTFQALRIAVNEELSALEEFLSHSLNFLSNGGRLVIISFHSLEDRIVKQTFNRFKSEKLGKVVTKKPVQASEDEVRRNPRSRSAKLRIFEKF